MHNFSTVTPGTLPVGTVTDLGTITQVSLTAYRIDGTWVAFRRVHGVPAAAEPLVILNGGW